MKSDLQLRLDVMNQLVFDPSVSTDNLAVSVSAGVVTLSGFVPAYAEKYAAEKVALRVAGVKAVADEIEVKVHGKFERTDQDIARAAADSLTWNVQVPSGVHVAVEDGVVILRGQVDWQFQRDAATRSVRYLAGVRDVKNRLKLGNTSKELDVKRRIEEAIVRSAEGDARQVVVSAHDGKVTLQGKVRSHAEAEAAKWAAWSAPGVCAVDCQLSIA